MRHWSSQNISSKTLTMETLAFTSFYSPPISSLLPLYHSPLSSPQKETLRKEKKENECFRGKVRVVRRRRFRLEEEEEKDSSSCRKYPKAAAAAGRRWTWRRNRAYSSYSNPRPSPPGEEGEAPPSIPLQCLGRKG